MLSFKFVEDFFYTNITLTPETKQIRFFHKDGFKTRIVIFSHI